MDYYRGWYRYTPAVPKSVKDGIKAKSKQGDFAQTAAGKQWISLLRSTSWSNRLARGKRYARMGQVGDFKITRGEVTASVQGTKARPYRIIISLKPFSREIWERVYGIVAENPLQYALLRAHKLNDDFLGLLNNNGIYFLPRSTMEIKTSCSCPDVANPCKHIAAVIYIVGEALDENPFLLFQMRGQPFDDFLESVRKLIPHALSDEEVQRESINPDISSVRFWEAGGEFRKINTYRRYPDVPYALLKLLGIPKFLPRTKMVLNQLESAYDLAGKSFEKSH